MADFDAAHGKLGITVVTVEKCKTNTEARVYVDNSARTINRVRPNSPHAEQKKNITKIIVSYFIVDIIFRILRVV
jgi:hypothetical protein